MDALQIHILYANYTHVLVSRARLTQVHTQAPNKMAAGAVSMVFHFRAWSVWKASIRAYMILNAG